MPSIWKDRVEVNGVVFNVWAEKPDDVIDWGIDELNGWDKLPAQEIISSPFGGGADGESLADVWEMRGRHVLVAGWFHAPTREQTEVIKDYIALNAFPRNTDIILTRYEGIPKSITARVEDRQFVAIGPNEYRWNAQLFAGDPLKYDAEEPPPAGSSGSAGVAGASSGGRTYPRTYPLTYNTILSGEANSIILFNRGIAGTSPFIEITGPLTKGGWRVSNDTTGEDIRYDLALALGDVLVIDFKEQTALLNGFPVTSAIVGDFWKVEPGVNVIKLYADYDPAASITASIKSAWE